LKLIDWPLASALKLKTAIVIPQSTVSLPPQYGPVDALLELSGGTTLFQERNLLAIRSP
jgi:hypothetical protein